MTLDAASWLAGAVVLLVAAVVTVAITVALYASAVIRRLDRILDELRRRDG